jgi:hypothetical protein
MLWMSLVPNVWASAKVRPEIQMLSSAATRKHRRRIRFGGIRLVPSGRQPMRPAARWRYLPCRIEAGQAEQAAYRLEITLELIFS